MPWIEYSDSVCDAKLAAGGGEYSDRLDHDQLDDYRCLAARSLGGRGAATVPRLGVAGDRPATVDDVDELGAGVIHKMLAMIHKRSLNERQR